MSNQTVRIAGINEELGKSLGRGGEGDVFALLGRSDQAVKIYKQELRQSREGKVRAMVESGLAEKTNLVAFPSEVAMDRSGTFAGFAMRLVSGYRPIHALYSPKSRKHEFPKADFRFLVRAAQNVARAVATVHQAGCVIGDFNHSGVLVGPDATVALIDADSFQFNLNGRSYPCVVGTEDFTPPELHGKNLSQIERTRAHDNFGLAVAVFQLLAMGKHPYSGRYNGADLSLGQAIAQHRFAYSAMRRNATGTTPPPGAVQLDDFPRPIALAFEAAFGLDPSARPGPTIWVKLLSELEMSLRRCSSNSTHFFPHAGNSCAWCRIASQSGVEMFPPTYAGAGLGPVPAGGPFDLGKITAAIRSAALPRPEDILPIWNGNSGPPLPAFRQAKSKQTLHRFVGGILVLVALIALTNAPGAAILWVILGASGLYRVATAKVDASPLIKAFTEADNRVRASSLAYLQRVGFTELFLLRNEMEGLIGQYQQLESGLTRDLERLKTTREARQRHAFLDSFLINRAKIPGIGFAKMATLASFGIESAADVDYAAVMAVPGFGDFLTGKLLQWRREQEAKFRYNPAASPADRQAEDLARAAAASKRAVLQNKIRSGLAALQGAPARFSTNKAVSDPALMKALTDRAKAERDCTALRIKLPPRAALNLPTPPSGQPSPAAYRASSSYSGATTGTASAALPPTAHPTATSVVSCPICHASMVRRRAHRGPFAGRLFWGCSRFPQCRGTRN